MARGCQALRGARHCGCAISEWPFRAMIPSTKLPGRRLGCHTLLLPRTQTLMPRRIRHLLFTPLRCAPAPRRSALRPADEQPHIQRCRPPENRHHPDGRLRPFRGHGASHEAAGRGRRHVRHRLVCGRALCYQQCAVCCAARARSAAGACVGAGWRRVWGRRRGGWQAGAAGAGSRSPPRPRPTRVRVTL